MVTTVYTHLSIALVGEGRGRRGVAFSFLPLRPDRDRRVCCGQLRVLGWVGGTGWGASIWSQGTRRQCNGTDTSRVPFNTKIIVLILYTLLQQRPSAHTIGPAER